MNLGISYFRLLINFQYHQSNYLLPELIYIKYELNDEKMCELLRDSPSSNGLFLTSFALKL
jgi:hypothetical protein